MEFDHCVVLITAGGEVEAQKIADVLLEKKLAACVNITAEVNSFFWWQNVIDHEAESMLIVKTRRHLLETIEEEVKRAHSYDVPEIIALPIVWGSTSYLDWLESQVKGETT